MVREGTLVVETLERIRVGLPFTLRALDVDNGSEFVNNRLIEYCLGHGIELTRSRPYRKNDQAWIEQKNGAVVRKLLGYRRFEGLAAARAITRLYGASRLFVNFFQPSFKLAAKATRRRKGDQALLSATDALPAPNVGACLQAQSRCTASLGKALLVPKRVQEPLSERAHLRSTGSRDRRDNVVGQTALYRHLERPDQPACGEVVLKELVPPERDPQPVRRGFEGGHRILECQRVLQHQIGGSVSL